MFGHDDTTNNHQDLNNSHGLPDPAAMTEPPIINSSLEASDTVTGNTSSPSDNIPNPIATPSAPPTTQAESTLPKSTQENSENKNSDLLALKNQALQQLSPLVGQLNQTPEEEFHTIMMMIQASDNQKMLPEAYKAAQKITDDKERAQALLDVINEINYFTQQS